MQRNTQLMKATLEIISQILEVDNIEDALSGTLEVVAKLSGSEAGAIWLLDEKINRLVSAFQVGPIDLTGITLENGVGTEGTVCKTGQSVCIENTAAAPDYEGTVFDDHGLPAKTLLCVPLNDMEKNIGCLILVNKTGGYESEEEQLCKRMAALAALTIGEKGFTVDAGEQKKVLISLRNVVKEFPSGEGSVQVLKGVNLDIYENEFVVVLGESGCGKSTMMNIIGGMDFLTSGELRIEGEDYSRPSDDNLTRFRRNYVGFIFQSYNLMPNLTALENVEFIAELVDAPMPSMEALDKVGLTGRANNFPAQLSGGQQQRVSIARALVKRPRMILADEPTAALDCQTSLEVLTVIEEIVKSQNTTVIMVTHNPEIAKMANRVIKLRSGRVASIKRNQAPLSASELVW